MSSLIHLATCDDGVFDLSEFKGADVSPEDSRLILPWTMSTEARDRQGDRIMQAGWDLKAYRKNPVIQWAHDYSLPPIGRALEVYVDSDHPAGPRLRALVEFTPEDMNPLGATVYRMAKAKFLRTASVGFRGLKWQEDVDTKESGEPRGVIFTRSELLENSIVPIPANPEALQGAKALGIDLGPISRWASMALDQGDRSAETIWTQTADRKIFSYASAKEDEEETEPMPPEDTGPTLADVIAQGEMLSEKLDLIYDILTADEMADADEEVVDEEPAPEAQDITAMLADMLAAKK